MERLAKTIKLAADLREGSWDKKKEKYNLSIQQSADLAAEKVGFDERGTTPIYLLLQCAWNDILDWAEQFD